MKNQPNMLSRDRAGLLVVDVQERIWRAVREPHRLIERIVITIKACRLLKIPIFVTEQYPQGLGATVPAIRKVLGGVKPLVKMSFSCCGEQTLIPILRKDRIEQVILVGIESHVCVMQTALDLLSQGFQVHVFADAISSRHKVDEQIALKRISNEGIVLSTVEMGLFELMKTAKAPEFKDVSFLIK